MKQYPQWVLDIFENTLKIETDKHTNIKNDSGGSTKWGVIEAVAREAGYVGKMEDLPKEFALTLSGVKYWNDWYTEIGEKISKEIAKEIFDTGYNIGEVTARMLTQRSLNVMNRQGNDWPDLTVDGKFGQRTFDAMSAAVKRRGEKHVLKVLNIAQGKYYFDLAEKREKDEDFFNGWVEHRVEI